MNNKVLLDSFLSEFREGNGLNDYSEAELFELFAAVEITKDCETDFTEVAESMVDGGNDGGIDTFIVFFNEQSISSLEELDDLKFTDKTRLKIVILQSKIGESFTEKTLDRLHISLPVILNLEVKDEELSKRFNAEILEKILILRHAWLSAMRKKASVEFRIAYACKAERIQVNQTFISKMEQIIGTAKKALSSAEVRFNLYSCEELIELYKHRPPLELELKFVEGPIPIPFSEAEYGYIGAVALRDYQAFICDSNVVREVLFESNIRHFQGDADVNKRITETLLTDQKHDFWWLNNGITIIASECRSVPKMLLLTGAQIVNGLQTSFALAYSFKEMPETDKRSLLVKVIRSSDKETTDRIIDATNRQNAVPPVLLRATDKVQRSIEQFFLAQGYYYDRRKGFYKNQNKPITKIFTIQEVAQAIEAVVYRNPSVARKNPTTIIKSDESYRRIFNPDTDFTIFLIAANVVRMTKILLSSGPSSEQNSFLRNFTYHIALLIVASALKKADWSPQDILAIDFAKLDAEHFKTCLLDFAQKLQTYTDATQENALNAAKSSSFDKYLLNP